MVWDASLKSKSRDTGLLGTGVVIPPDPRLLPTIQIELARVAEAIGYSRAWVTEAGAGDAFALLASMSLATSQIGLATGVVPVQTRSPLLLAQASATVQALSGGRFVLGVGLSSRTVVEDWNGLTFEPTLAGTRRRLEIVERLLQGESVTAEGAIRMRGARLLMDIATPPPIVLGALGPRMMDLGQQHFQGTLINYVGSRSLTGIIEQLRAARPPGRAAASTAVFVRVSVSSDGAEQQRGRAKREVMGHVIVPPYARFLARQGWGDAVERSLSLWNRGERARAAASLPDEMVDELVLFGEAADVRAGLELFAATGVGEVVVFPIPLGDEGDPTTHVRRTLEAVAA